MDGGLKRSRNDDPFENFQMEPPKQPALSSPNATGFRQFGRRSRYRAMPSMSSLSGSRDFASMFGSNSSISALSGSSQNLIGGNKLLNLQEDARSRRISAEVMKHRLYESVIVSPRHRRLSMRADDGDQNQYMMHPSRMAMSMPVTPAHSHNVTPQHSPTSTSRRFQWPGWFSRGTTPLSGTTPTEDQGDGGSIMEVEEDSWKGLACLFKPQPKYVPAGRWSQNVETEQDQEMDIEGRRTSPVQDHADNGSAFLRDVPKRQKRCPSPSDEQDTQDMQA